MTSKSASQKLDRWTTRLLLCVVTAVIVSVTAYLCAWLQYRPSYSRTEKYLSTRKDLERLRVDIERQKATSGDWPASLADLNAVNEKQIHTDEAGNPVDGWGGPINYRIQGGGYVLFSYGRGGTPGGVGEYADLHAGKADSWPERPTLAQFSELTEARPVQLACLLAGAVAFPLCLLQAKRQSEDRPSKVRVLLGIAVTAVFAILAALMMSAVHMIQGGH